MPEKIPKEILKILNAVKSKRPKTVIEHIVNFGFITTEELKEKYGYDHPPRAARDVRELGIPLETFRIKDSSGKSIGAYRFDSWNKFNSDKKSGRNSFSKQFKSDLIEQYGEHCAICSAKLDKRYLQIDHRIPYEIGGDSNSDERIPEDYLLLCASCNRAKSWSCEHCANWLGDKILSACASCFWASPLEYKHIAMQDMRRLILTWQGNEVSDFDLLKNMANEASEEIPDFVKQQLSNALKGK